MIKLKYINDITIILSEIEDYVITKLPFKINLNIKNNDIIPQLSQLYFDNLLLKKLNIHNKYVIINVSIHDIVHKRFLNY